MTRVLPLLCLLGCAPPEPSALGLPATVKPRPPAPGLGCPLTLAEQQVRKPFWTDAGAGWVGGQGVVQAVDGRPIAVPGTVLDLASVGAVLWVGSTAGLVRVDDTVSHWVLPPVHGLTIHGDQVVAAMPDGLGRIALDARPDQAPRLEFRDGKPLVLAVGENLAVFDGRDRVELGDRTLVHQPKVWAAQGTDLVFARGGEVWTESERTAVTGQVTGLAVDGEGVIIGTRTGVWTWVPAGEPRKVSDQPVWEVGPGGELAAGADGAGVLREGVVRWFAEGDEVHAIPGDPNLVAGDEGLQTPDGVQLAGEALESVAVGDGIAVVSTLRGLVILEPDTWELRATTPLRSTQPATEVVATDRGFAVAYEWMGTVQLYDREGALTGVHRPPGPLHGAALRAWGNTVYHPMAEHGLALIRDGSWTLVPGLDRAFDVAPWGDGLAVAAGDHGLILLDATNKLVGRCPVPGTARRLAVNPTGLQVESGGILSRFAP